MVQKRDIVVSIILTIVTCGIYGIYWFIVLTDETAKVTENHSLSGGMSFLLTLVTCGIYGIYWSYKMGKITYEYSLKNNLGLADNSVVYLLLDVFGFGIVNYCLMQNDLNQIIESK